MFIKETFTSYRDAREKDVGRLFEECGRIVRLQFKANFAFVEYDSNASAEDAVNKFNGKDFMGRRLVVEPYVYRYDNACTHAILNAYCL